MRQSLLTLILLFVFVSLGFADNGMINVKSPHNVKRTADRLESTLREKGMTVFIRINHAEGAQKVGEQLRPTELLIFGNPKVGTPLMQCSQSVAIDLPQKALIWEDEAGQVWLSYNDPKYLAKRHGITECVDIIKKIEKALSNFVHAAAML
ncbi:MAG: DUF302 domain-containing protein [Candidatus Methylomirabilales bacterium]